MPAHNHKHDHHCAHDHHHDHDHNHGVLSNAVNYISHKASAGNEWIGNKFGGRAKSGRVGRATRITRGVSNAAAVGITIAGVITVGTTIASGGLAAPLWILLGGGIAVAANLVAVGIGSGANHLKISQYYDALVEINAENSRLLKLAGKDPQALPHGIKQYWEKDRKLFKMTLNRRGQEIVSVAGTAMTGALMLSAAGALVIAPPAAVGLFFAARGISCATTAGSAYNTKDRLKIYKEILYKFGQQYIEVTGQRDRAKQTQAIKIVAEVFAKLNMATNVTDITNSQQWRTFNIAHCVYKMLFTQSEQLPQKDRLAFLNPNNQQRIVDELVTKLRPLIKEEKSFWNRNESRYFSRKALQKLDSSSQYSEGGKIALLDSMPILGMKLEVSLTKKLIGLDKYALAQSLANKIITDLNINKNKDSQHKAIEFSITKAVAKGIQNRPQDTVINEIKTAIQPYLKAETYDAKVAKKLGGLRPVNEQKATRCLILDTQKLSKDFPAQGHAHGSNFLPHYHLSRLADSISAAATDHKPIKEEPHQHHHNCSGHHKHNNHKSINVHSMHEHKNCLHHHHDAEPLSVDQNTYSYADLKKSLLNNQSQLTKEIIAQQQAGWDKLKKNAKKFILVRSFKDGKGNSIYLWDHPSHPEQKAYQITYVVNDNTREIAVRYGAGYLQKKSPTTIVGVDCDADLGIGVRLLEIGKGRHIGLGDSRNGRINLADSGLFTEHKQIARSDNHQNMIKKSAARNHAEELYKDRAASRSL